MCCVTNFVMYKRLNNHDVPRDNQYHIYNYVRTLTFRSITTLQRQSNDEQGRPKLTEARMHSAGASLLRRLKPLQTDRNRREPSRTRRTRSASWRVLLRSTTKSGRTCLIVFVRHSSQSEFLSYDVLGTYITFSSAPGGLSPAWRQLISYRP